MTALLPWERLGSKVGDRHLERLAVVYVRQSTRQQVADHSESTRLQYGLVERAVGLGWPGSRALLADADGVYDPVDYNDRLLLGLKGTMSEAELHLLKQRMLAGKQAKARRGELAIGLPIGYVRRASGEATLDPDEQVQTVVRLIFAKFAELGSVQGVVRFLVEHGIQLGVRARSGPDKGEIVWKRPARATITGMINSPIYAGVYVYGRRLTDRTGVRAADGRGGRGG